LFAPVSARKIELEDKRRLAMECSKRCFYSNSVQGEDIKEFTDLNYGEKVCMSRCLAKFI